MSSHNSVIRAQSIYNVIDVERFRFRERKPVRPIFLHNRGLEELYNVPCTLKAFGLVQQRYPEACLTIAHDGPLRAELEQMVQRLGPAQCAVRGNRAPG